MFHVFPFFKSFFIKKRKQMSRIEEKKIIELFEEGLERANIAKKLNRPYVTVCKTLTRLGFYSKRVTRKRAWGFFMAKTPAFDAAKSLNVPVERVARFYRDFLSKKS